MPSVGSVMRDRIFSSVRLAGAVAADDADDLAAADLEADILERPDVRFGVSRAIPIPIERSPEAIDGRNGSLDHRLPEGRVAPPRGGRCGTACPGFPRG